MEEIKYQQVARIKVFGVGGAGCNAVNRMVEKNTKGAIFYVCNTDVQNLSLSNCENKIVLGPNVTKGLGAGGLPEVGQQAALESEDEIREAMTDADMIFITAGLGGGTGTGAAPIFAKIAKDLGALTVGIVTKPFSFEGNKRMAQAMAGLEEMKKYVDSLIIISNNKVLEVCGDVPVQQAFVDADNVLRQGVQTITDLIAVPALINLDFADVRNVMEGQGTALIGIGMDDGEDKARKAASKALQSPLLEARISGAKKAIINVTGGPNISLYDANVAVETIKEAAGNDMDTIFGIAVNETLGDNIIVTVFATGFDIKEASAPRINIMPERIHEDAPRATVEVQEEDDDIPTFFKTRS
ncbi:MAG: cell division protein FtsZ [Erysipelotrichaceae bacterium]|nr:cell division protein FtsZ [Erysipelotrichaceae bacterium]